MNTLALPYKFRTGRRKTFKADIPKPKSTFTTFMDEGFIHYRSGHFRKALFCFDRVRLTKITL